MSASPVTFRCFECGAALGGHHWRVCAVCSRMFCRRHLIVETGTAMCVACKSAGRKEGELKGESEGRKGRTA